MFQLLISCFYIINNAHKDLHTRVLTFGSYILLLFAIYGAIVVFSRSHNDTLRLETFAQCVNRPRGQPINSLKIDIRLEKDKPEYEIPLSDFTNLLVMNNITKKEISWIA